MNKVKKMCLISVLTALYVVLGAFLKINLIGNISLDLGYLAFAVALCECGIYGAFVGVAGCSLESILFSAYGFSIGWTAGNAVIGIICGLYFMREKRAVYRAIVTVIAVALGILCVKTGVECALYQIPLAVKIPKSFTAFVLDSAVMIAGVVLFGVLKKKKL